MVEIENAQNAVEVPDQESGGEKRQVSQKVKLRSVFIGLVLALVLAIPAFAENESTGFNNVMAQWSNLTTLMNNVWALLTGNEYFALFLALALLGAGISVFRRVKSAARH